MNCIYRLLRHDKTGTLVAVPENTKRAGRKISSCTTAMDAATRLGLTALAVVLLVSSVENVYALPAGGIVTSGGASISSGAASTTINQSTQNAAINWQSFNIGQTESVRFVQPNSNSVALNRVLGSDPSSILGSLSANGKLFLMNPNGVLFGKGASVNVSGLVASTLNITDNDFMAGTYKFSGAGNGTIINQGSINTDGGYVALLGANVSNDGIISARLGTVALAAGNAITLDVVGDGLLNLSVDEGAVNSLVQNGGLIQADGGQILLTAQAAGGLLQGVVNNRGVIQAQTIVNHNGTIKLLGDMQGGSVSLGGKLDASAPNGGAGGFIETSAAHVKIADNAIVTTQSASGATGTWLIDPQDFTIGAGGDITGSTLSANLVSSNITILNSSGATAGNGDIHVNDAVTWTATPVPTTLTLNAERNINVNAAISPTDGNLVMLAGNDVNINAAITTVRGDVTSTAGRDVNIIEAITTTDGSLSSNAGRTVNINMATLTTTRGDLVLNAGNDGVSGGTVIFTAGTPPATVTGPGATVKIYNPIGTTTDYTNNLILTDAVLNQYLLVFTQGLTGPAGPEGIQGIQGLQGIQGITGDKGLQGMQGIQGLQGIQGIIGDQGIKGDIGLQGIQGLQGLAGATGDQGLVGADGLPGTPGTPGLAGADGATGLTGADGLPGTPGTPGLAGADGATGLTGADGLPGTPGTPGLAGADGATGLTGADGLPGTPGTPGLTGADGLPGTPGLPGIAGEKGDQGLDGADGLPGTPGLASADGATGPIGPAGTTPIEPEVSQVNPEPAVPPADPSPVDPGPTIPPVNPLPVDPDPVPPPADPPPVEPEQQEVPPLESDPNLNQQEETPPDEPDPVIVPVEKVQPKIYVPPKRPRKHDRN